MTAKKRLGTCSDLYCAPVFSGLVNEPSFECVVDLVARNAARMREHELEAAFLTPIDYARESSDYHIIPNVAVSSCAGTATIVLIFKEGLHTINTLAVCPTSTSEVVLAAILLSERFDVRPKILPVMGSLEESMRLADAALLVGDEAMEQASRHKNKLDLVEEWNDITDLPYVHGFWCMREGELTSNDIATIQHACKVGVMSLDDIVSSGKEKRALQIPPHTLKQYLENFSLTFTEREQEAVTEFLRFAYYHGVLPDVADLHFSPVEGDDETIMPDPSLN